MPEWIYLCIANLSIEEAINSALSQDLLLAATDWILIRLHSQVHEI